MHSYKIIINKLLKRNISISIVESCTGGLLSSKFTSIPGISKIFNIGLITYSNKSKTSLLKISSNDSKSDRRIEISEPKTQTNILNYPLMKRLTFHKRMGW